MKLWLAAAVVLVGSLVWLREPAPASNLRRFDPDAVALAETEMWQAYYAGERFRLFAGLTELLRNQYGLAAPRAATAAFYAARAARTFQAGQSRRDYEEALPDLVEFYRRILPTAGQAPRVARLELEWWIGHRQRSATLTESLAELQAALYDIPVARAREHAELRAAAMHLRDNRAAAGMVREADWREIAELLRRSWRSLHAATR